MTQEQINGACHCGPVEFRVRLTDGFRIVRRCTCSYCRMRGAIVVSADLDDIDIADSHDAPTLYQFGAMTAKHYFCGRCGIYTYHQRRSNPHQYGINVACLQGVSPFDFDEVPVNDGIDHPADAAANSPRVAGILRYERNPT